MVIIKIIRGKEFDTVMVAVGRVANTNGLNLENAGVKVNPLT
jgi:pyruvate/2-oxoglutarate dehydrogenase complex dihydrolipoamide dehydrogenase (E3) component